MVIGKQSTLRIPKTILEKLSLKEGQRVLIRVEAEKLVLEPLPLAQDPYEVLAQVVGAPYEEAVDEPEAEAWVKRHAGH